MICTSLIPLECEPQMKAMLEELRKVPHDRREAALVALCTIWIKTNGTLELKDLRP